MFPPTHIKRLHCVALQRQQPMQSAKTKFIIGQTVIKSTQEIRVFSTAKQKIDKSEFSFSFRFHLVSWIHTQSEPKRATEDWRKEGDRHSRRTRTAIKAKGRKCIAKFIIETRNVSFDHHLIRCVHDNIFRCVRLR